MATDLSLRRYRPAADARVREVHEAALRDAGAYVEGVPEPDLEDVVGSYLEIGGEFLVGEVDGRVVATGAFRPADGPVTEHLDVSDGAAELKRMRVDQAHHRRGYGRRIYDELERRARERGFGTLVLDTMPELTAARRLYESEGFRAVHRERFEQAGEEFELLYYGKRWSSEHRGRLEAYRPCPEEETRDTGVREKESKPIDRRGRPWKPPPREPVGV